MLMLRRILLGVVGLIVVGLVIDALIKYGPRPDISVSGQVTDLASGSGIPGTFVLVNIEASRAGFLSPHGHTGCTGGGVVQTDVEGKFHYRVAMADVTHKPWPQSIGPNLKIYKPGYVDEPKQHMIGLLPETDGTRFTMVSKQEQWADRRKTIDRVFNNSCVRIRSGDGWIEFERAVYQELSDYYCRGELKDDLTYWTFYEVRDLLVGRIYDVARHQHPDQTEEEYKVAMNRALRSLSDAMPEYPFGKDPVAETDPPRRPLTIEEKARVCAIIDSKEYRP